MTWISVREVRGSRTTRSFSLNSCICWRNPSCSDPDPDRSLKDAARLISGSYSSMTASFKLSTSQRISSFLVSRAPTSFSRYSVALCESLETTRSASVFRASRVSRRDRQLSIPRDRCSPPSPGGRLCPAHTSRVLYGLQLSHNIHRSV